MEMSKDTKELHDELMAMKRRINTEVGTEPPCPFCQKPRVPRSGYIRCNPCGINWFDGEDLAKDPKLERYEKMVASMRVTASSPTGPRTGVAPVV
jgi:ribosomal protein L37AE/L43A